MFTALLGCLEGLRRRYAEPHRAYHTQAHVDAVLLAVASGPADDRAAMEVAAWFHDAIYDPAARDNEERSAALLEAELGGLADPALIGRAAALVRLTADHSLPPGMAAGLREDAARFLDADMAVLGAGAGAFDAYERGIAAEYVPVHGAAAYAAGRRRFLEAMLARPRLFLTEEAHSRLDGAARANIRRVLGRGG